MAAISLTIGTAYTQNFDTLASTGTSSILPNGWLFSESGANANVTYTAVTGTSGDTYSFGSGSDRALGAQASGSLVSTFGAQFVNNTGATITRLSISFSGEQWRSSTSAQNALNFSYQVGATSLTTGNWTDVDTLDYVGGLPVTTNGSLDGNSNAMTINGELSGLNLSQGEEIWIRWVDFNDAGNDAGLAIDNFSITPTTTVSTNPIVSIAAQDASASEAGQDPGNFRITRTGDTASDLIVSYTLGGTAASGDYTPTLAGTATILAGQSFVDVAIIPVDDADVEVSETVTLTLVDAAEYDLGASIATVTIADNDVVVVPSVRIHDIQGGDIFPPMQDRL